MAAAIEELGGSCVGVVEHGVQQHCLHASSCTQGPNKHL